MSRASEFSFDWDEANRRHLADHRVSAGEFEEVMRNDPMLFDYDNVDGEDRWTGLGTTNGFRV